MSVSDLCPVSAFAGLPATKGSGGGLIATERELGIARVTARSRQRALLERLFHERYGIALPSGPRRACRRDVAAAGVAPESWMVTCESAGNDFAASLRSACGAHASIVDLSDACAVLRLAGPCVRATLAKLLALDLHERRFAPGDVAQTVAAHMSVTLWRLEQAQRGPAMFEICVGRSLAHELYGAIRDSAAEFGFEFEPAPAPVCRGAIAP